MIKNLFEEQHSNLNYFFDEIDLLKAKSFIAGLLESKGTLILTGVGKSGIIANKIAMTLLSTGTQAIYLPALDALHGDIGIVKPEDICILISKSGDTKELLSLVPYIRKKGAKIFSILSNEKSKLAELSDEFILLPLKKELCPFNLSPTTSSSIQMIFGDILAVALMKAKKFSIDEYAKNHPAGSIGKKISLTVEDIMIKEDLPLCLKEDLIIDVLPELSAKKCGCLIVVSKEKELEGIFTDGDLRRAIHQKKKDFFQAKIQDVMTTFPKYTTPTVLAWEALKQMEEGKLVTAMPVILQKKVVGILRMHDVVQAGLCE